MLRALLGSATPYLIIGAVLAAGLVIGGSYWHGYANGKEAVLQKLKDERITLLKDGQKIDDEVLNADDAELCELLGSCG